MTYYSQLGQDKYLNEFIFKGKKDGTFLDIGANDGIELSNTKFFEELGWKGVCIEPQKSQYDLLIKNRNCQSLNIGVWKDTGEVKFMNVKGVPHMLSGIMETMDEKHIERIKMECDRDGGAYEIIPMEVISVSDLFKMFGYTRFDYCSLDTEGSELEILKSIDFRECNIGYFTVENNNNTNDVKTFMEQNGYPHIAQIEFDDVFRRDDGHYS